MGNKFTATVSEIAVLKTDVAKVDANDASALEALWTRANIIFDRVIKATPGLTYFQEVQPILSDLKSIFDAIQRIKLTKRQVELPPKYEHCVK